MSDFYKCEHGSTLCGTCTRALKTQHEALIAERDNLIRLLATERDRFGKIECELAKELTSRKRCPNCKVQEGAFHTESCCLLLLGTDRDRWKKEAAALSSELLLVNKKHLELDCQKWKHIALKAREALMDMSCGELLDCIQPFKPEILHHSTRCGYRKAMEAISLFPKEPSDNG